MFSIRLKQLRKKAGYKSQQAFADAFGVAQSTVGGWESGKRKPSRETIIRLADFLNTSIDYLMGCASQKETPSPTSKDGLNAEQLELVNLFEAAPPVLRSAALAVLKSAKEQQSQLDAMEMDVEKVIRFSIPGYIEPMSAGTGQEAGHEYPENYILVKEPPQGTSFIARVSGNSMEPTYHDGDLVFVHSIEEIPIGKIGAFFMDGRQWIKERGNGVLISHNPEYAPRSMTEDVRCQGLVLGVCDESYFE